MEGKIIKPIKKLFDAPSVFEEKMKVVYTCGVYDMFHVGHARLLKNAKALGDILIVGLILDTAVKKKKGKNRPIIPWADRYEILNSVKYVDYVVPQKNFNPKYELSKLNIDIFAKGEDQSHIPVEKIKDKKFEIIILPRTQHVSTSKLEKRLKNDSNIK